MAKSGPETKLLNKMRDAAADAFGSSIVQIKYHGGPYSSAGVSDTLHCVDGIFVAIEVKAPESHGGSVERALANGPTVKQRAFVRKVLEAGGVAGFAATVDQYLEILDCAYQRHGGFGGCGQRCSGHNV